VEVFFKIFYLVQFIMNFGLCLGKGWAATLITGSEILRCDKGSESLERKILLPDIIQTARNEWH
jgi:hypothetical protein